MASGAHHHHNNQACSSGGHTTSSITRLQGGLLCSPATPVTIEFLPSKLASITVDLNVPPRVPIGWERLLDLKTGRIFYRKYEEMSRKNKGKGLKLDVRLTLSPPPRGNTSRVSVDASPDSPDADGSSSSSLMTSPPSSCVSSETEQGLRCSNSPEATSMVLAGCPRCLMYVMLSEADPKCPKCKSPVLIDFHHNTNANKTKTKTKNS